MDPGFKGLMTRLQTVAKYEGVTVADLVQRPDNHLMRLPGMGRKTVALAAELRARPVNALWFWAV
jgi:endonuclease III